MSIKYGAWALDAGYLRLQTHTHTHTECVILISSPRHGERPSLFCWNVLWPFLFFPVHLRNFFVYCCSSYFAFYTTCIVHLRKSVMPYRKKTRLWAGRSGDAISTEARNSLFPPKRPAIAPHNPPPLQLPIQWVLNWKSTRKLEIHQWPPPNTEFNL